MDGQIDDSPLPAEAEQARGTESAPEARPAYSITVTDHGPLLVRGDIALLAPDGTPLERSPGTIALCRCGASGRKPFCDGTHKQLAKPFDA